MQNPPLKNPKLNLVTLQPKLKRLDILRQLKADIASVFLSKVAAPADIANQHDLCVFALSLVRANNGKIVLTNQEEEDIVVSLLLQIFPQLNNDFDLARLKSFVQFIDEQGLVAEVSQLKVGCATISNLFKKK